MGGEVWAPGTYEPTVAQWARAEALHEARELLVAGARGTLHVEVVEALARRWARYIETGEVEGEVEGA